MAAQPAKCKMLVVFDFDETIIDGTTIYEVHDLHPGPYRAERQPGDMMHGWNKRNTAFFASLHSHGVGISAIKKAVIDIPLVAGMDGLLKYLCQEDYEVVIMSGANTLFIEWYLAHKQLNDVIDKVYTNVGEIKDDKLVTSCYHHQDSCKLCVKSFCKGQILDEVVKNKQLTGTPYSSVCYVGDGYNDFCPVLRLTNKDYVFPRANYALDAKLRYQNSRVSANVISWNGASEIEIFFRKFTEQRL